MQKRDNKILCSATDLVNYLECEHLTTLDLIDLETPLPRTSEDDQAKLLQARGYSHEADFWAVLQARHAHVIDIAALGGDLSKKIDNTLSAMGHGHDVIFQATLADGNLIGHADFLRKVDRPSALGNWSYEVLDTKLARTEKAKFLIQLGFYSALLAKAQGLVPLQMHVVLGNLKEVAYRCADYSRYLSLVNRQFLGRITGAAAETYPVPCEKCALCKWSGLCEERRRRDDHLCQVANISRIQIKRLESDGVSTLAALARLSPERRIPKMTAEAQERLHRQAGLQLMARETGKNQLELLAQDEHAGRGFGRLPEPGAGDLFFDMEGNPLEEGGLEYLFGLYFIKDEKPEFMAFWGHNRSEEKKAFEEFMDFVTSWLQKHPAAHIYHYANYEQTALTKLMSLHGTREAQVDNLLRTHKFVDLYKVVREGMRVSEPRYSIKNMEHFYLERRSGDVTSAGASIVYYERWKETGDPQLLLAIEAYNLDDVRSTYELRQWLLTHRPAGLAWANAVSEVDGPAAVALVELTKEESRLIPYRERLVDTLPKDRATWTSAERLKELTYQLLDFHRRAEKPGWWKMFERMEMDEGKILEDGACLAGLRADPANPPKADGGTILHTFLFPDQESKLKTGDSATITQTGEPVRDLKIDAINRRISFKHTAENEPLPVAVCIGPGLPVASKVLINAIFRFADSLMEGSGASYPAVAALLSQSLPKIRGISAGSPLLEPDSIKLPQIVAAISNLESSYLFVQGPPGAGKTYTGSHVIVALLKKGARVGISSSSHKAINNLLDGVVKVANEQGITFRGAKKSTKGKVDSYFEGDQIENVFTNKAIWGTFGSAMAYQLVAGTAWLFSAPDMDQQLDYIFIDEAGQVALANLVAMGTSAKNIVLLGDQMQLGQPIQGVHPGRSGESSLDYLLDGVSTIPAERGIFLSTTWRMHPDLCRFISDAVYDGRLEAEPNNANQRLLLADDAHPDLMPAGLRYVPIEHDACSQRSQEEADLVAGLFKSLLMQRYRDKHCQEHQMTLQDILVVAPYNSQVNLLKQVLPDGARVGTVDKFQGQEAEAVIVSMATSSGDYLPRNIEFLYSKNRLNVAISRAKCLAIFIANPALMAIRCTTPEEMTLVNTLCWVKDFEGNLRY